MTKEEFIEILDNYRKYAYHFLKIKTKTGKLLPFVLNKIQDKIDSVVEKAISEGRPLRFIILKARQEGVSTYFAGRIFQRTANDFHRKAVIVGHEVKSANNLLEMENRFYENLPPQCQPRIGHSNEKKLSFAALDSSIEIGSADVGETLERSATIQDLLATEVAFWRDAKSSLNALLQTIPDDKNTLVAIESTANGVGGEFYDRWKDAVEGRNDFIPIFIAWFELPEYSLLFADEEQRDRFSASVTSEEIDLANAYGLTLEQLNWRRYTIANKCGGRVDDFRQEYPSNEDEAFLTSGRPVFDPEICKKNYESSVEPLQRGDLIYTYDDKKKVNGVTFIRNSAGFISLFEKYDIDPLERYRFAAGCDVAEGLEQGDYNDIPILDRKTMKVVLEWHGHIHPDKLAEEQHKIQLFLKNNVYFCTERNNHGLSTIVVAYRLGVNQYYDSDFSSGYEVTTDRIGFKTTGSTKPKLVNDFIPAIRDGLFVDQDKEFWGEMRTFVRNARGQMQAQNKDQDPATKCFDDRVIARMLMWRCHQWLPPYRQLTEKTQEESMAAAIAEYYARKHADSSVGGEFKPGVF